MARVLPLGRGQVDARPRGDLLLHGRQDLRHLPGAPRPRLRIRVQEREHELLEALRNAGAGAEDGDGRTFRRRQPSGEQLVEHHAQGVEVRARIGPMLSAIAAQALGRQVSGSAGHRIRRGQGLQDRRQPDVQELPAPLGSEDDVPRFEVAVDGAEGMQGREGLRHLPAEPADHVERHRMGELEGIRAPHQLDHREAARRYSHGR